MKKKLTKKESILNENDLDTKYKIANQKFKILKNNPPDFEKASPEEIYTWIKNMINLTKL